MKCFVRPLAAALYLFAASLSLYAQTNYNSLSAVAGFGSHGNGTLYPGEVFWLSTTNSQRGMAYNPTTSHLILVDRQSANTGATITGSIYIIDSSNGNNLGALNLSSMTNGGAFADYAVGVADDGAIYVANLTTGSGSGNFSLYRFASEDTGPPPATAFNGLLTATNISMRFGDTMDVRGSGTGTQIILGSRTGTTPGTNVVILTTADGVTFTPTLIATDANADDFGGGITFGPGNTFWGNYTNHALRQMSFNLGTSNATTLRVYGTNTVASAGGRQGSLAIDATHNLLATLEFVVGGPDVVRLFDISNPNIPPVLLDSKVSPTNGQDNIVGFLDFGGNQLYVHDMNSGISAFNVDANAASAPTVTLQPVGQKIVAGQTLSLSAGGLRAASYQWRRNGANISSATNTLYVVPNAQTANGGTYTLVLSNLVGTATSSNAVVTILDPNNFPHLSPMWALAPLSRSYLGLDTGSSGTPDSQGRFPAYRSIAYNSKSNQVYIISRTTQTGGLTINVLDATTGADLYRLNTTGISQGDILLVAADCDDDGAIYAANVSRTSGTTTAVWKLYRWANSSSNTVPTVIFGPGDAADESYTVRWGDAMKVRGSGTNVQVLVDAHTVNAAETFDATNTLASILTPSGTDLSVTWNHIGFFSGWTNTSGESIGRTLEFANGTTSAIWQKRKGGRLDMTSIPDLTSISRIGTVLASYTNFPSSIGEMTFGNGLPTNIVLGIDYSGGNANGSTPDNLDLFEISDPTAPIILGQYAFPTNHQANGNYIGQVVATSNYVFAVDGNNGVMAFSVQQGAPTSAPAFTIQPISQRVLVSSNASFTGFAQDAASYQWRFNGTNINGATSTTLAFASAQLTNSGTYTLVASNVVGTATSSAVTLTVVAPSSTYSLSQSWSILPNSVSYLTTSASATPLERGLAYNALSNQVYIIHRADQVNGLVIKALDAATGNYLYDLHTDGITNGDIVLLAMGVGADGALYAANEDTTNTSRSVAYTLYRWADSGPNTLPTIVYSGDPSGLNTTLRWGDTMDVRGSGVNTEVVIDNNQGTMGSVLRPTDGSMTAFTAYPFNNAVGSGSIGRSLQFGSTNSMWQKRKGANLQLSTYNTNSGTSSVIASYGNFFNFLNLGPVAIDSSRHLLAAIDFTTSTSVPDMVDLFEISDLNAPLLLGRYPFATNHLANANFIGQLVFTSDKVYALDANNGMVAFTINSPNVTPPTLKVTKLGANVTLSWPSSATGFSLQGTANLSAPAWTGTGTAVTNGDTISVTEPIAGTKFYRLQK